MQSLSEEEKRQVLGSVLADELAAIQEAVKDVPLLKTKLDELSENVGKMSDDLKVVRAAISNMSDQVNDHERQIANLQSI